MIGRRCSCFDARHVARDARALAANYKGTALDQIGDYLGVQRRIVEVCDER